MLKIDNKEFVYFFLHPSDFLMIENNRSEITPYGNWDQSPEKPKAATIWKDSIEFYGQFPQKIVLKS